ncbi:MAG: tetratricopeptide repeat protein [Endomicrobiaceae bacterium]|nr:tetratricopeptide repeat protein [Endomicrobiaceae bacterium]
MNKKVIAVSLLMLSFFTVSYAGEDMNRGSKLYEKKDFKGAIENFQKAQVKKPTDPMINYNLASAYYKAGDFDKALESYDTALNNTQDINFKSAILYNMGNCAYRKGDNDLSLQYYKSSLKLNSKDVQAKHNIEFLQSDKNKNKDNKKDNKDNKDKNKNKNKDDKDQKQQEQQKEQDKKDKQEQKKDQYLLDYFDKQDKQNQNKQQNATAVSNKRNSKPW